MPNDYSIFVGIPSYRDSQIVPTVKSLCEKAADASKLRIVIFLQHDLSTDQDQTIYAELQNYIQEQ